MRLLYLTPRFPHPSSKGDQLAAYHRTVHLARRHDITLVSLYEDESELGDLGYWEWESVPEGTELRLLFVSSATFRLRSGSTRC